MASAIYGDNDQAISPGARNVPYLANIDPELATVTSAERERLLGSGRSFTFASRDTLADLYRNAGDHRCH